MVLSKFRHDINKVKFNNQYQLDEAAQRALMITLSHPFSYSRILMQVGYEPFTPYLVDTLFGGSKYVYPSVFKFIEFIRTEDGLPGLFRGIGFRICSELTQDFLYLNTLDLCKQIDKLANENEPKDGDKKKKLEDSYEADDESDDGSGDSKTQKRAAFNAECILKLIRKLICKSTSKTIALAISFPLHVCFVRSCCQFIGRERTYNFSPFNLAEIVRQGNLYDGFAPKLFAELLIIWLSSTMSFTVEALIQPDLILNSYVNYCIVFFASSVAYPLQLTSIVMAVNHTPLLAAKIEMPFYSWMSCYESLEKRNQLKRGSSLFWRYMSNAYKPQAYIRSYIDDDK